MTTTEAESLQITRLRMELEHKDQLLASVYARADTLQAVVERLERQLDSAIEAQREAATERSELRRLLGNAQLQVHALMQLPAPESNGGAPGEAEAPRMELPQRPEVPPTEPAKPASARSATAQPRPAASPPRPRARPQQPRGIVEEARGMFSNLRRMI